MIDVYSLDGVRPTDLFSAALQDVLGMARLSAAMQLGEPMCYYVHGPGIETGELLFFPDKRRGWLYVDGLCYDLRGRTAFDLLEQWQAEREKREASDGQ